MTDPLNTPHPTDAEVDFALNSDGGTRIQGTDGTWPDALPVVQFLTAKPDMGTSLAWGTFGVKWKASDGKQYGEILRLPPNVFKAFLDWAGKK